MTDQKLRAALADPVQAVRETSLEICDLKRQSVAVNMKWSTCTQGLAYPPKTKILSMELGLDTFMLRPKSRRNGHTAGSDVVGDANGRRNAATIVEVRSHLRDDAIEQLGGRVSECGHSYPEHVGQDADGAFAAAGKPDRFARQAVENGLYLARIRDEEFDGTGPRGSKPKAFQPAGSSPPGITNS